MQVPNPTPILRFIHIENLETTLRRGGIHAPNNWPKDGLTWRILHNVEVQAARGKKVVPCKPGGVIHDYIPFYFGHHSPMLLNLKTGLVKEYPSGGQVPFIYLVSSAQKVDSTGNKYVFTDGHALAAYSQFFNNPSDLREIDWATVQSDFWNNTPNDNDRQRRKQAEFMVHWFFDWSLVEKIVVINEAVKIKVKEIMAAFPEAMEKIVEIERGWYYK